MSNDLERRDWRLGGQGEAGMKVGEERAVGMNSRGQGRVGQ